jgi:hypothetical protein
MAKYPRVHYYVPMPTILWMCGLIEKMF